MRRERRERFPRHRGLAIPTCTRRDVCRDRWLAVSIEVGDGENVRGIPGACATRNFTYLIRGPCHFESVRVAAFTFQFRNGYDYHSTQ